MVLPQCIPECWYVRNHSMSGGQGGEIISRDKYIVPASVWPGILVPVYMILWLVYITVMSQVTCSSSHWCFPLPTADSASLCGKVPY